MSERTLTEARAADDGAAKGPVALVAPLPGLVSPLAETPDPAFAGGALGDGLAVDPTGATLRAPCAGVIVAVATARHAVTIRAENGAEILLHVGVETVALEGEGFRTLTRAGARVDAGAPLIAFDMDFVARRAKSLVTPVLVVNGEAFAVTRRAAAGEIAEGDFLFEVAPRAVAPATEYKADDETKAEETALVAMPHGIHARPAADIAAAARAFASDVRLVVGAREANARSVSSLMSLGAKMGDAARVLARGRDALEAARAVAALIGPSGRSARRKGDDDPQTEENSVAGPFAGETVLTGVCAAPGFAVGEAVLLAPESREEDYENKGLEVERAALDAAREAARRRLVEAMDGAGQAQRGILRAHADLLDDPELAEAAAARVAAGESALAAWRGVMREQAARMRAMADPRMAERAADFLDLERQVADVLLGRAPQASPMAEGAVLIAEEVYPSQLLRADGARPAAIATAAGGASSHAAILAASLGAPMVVAAGRDLLRAPAGAPVIVDADRGEIVVNPNADRLARARERLARRRARRAQALETARAACRTRDGARIEALANLASPAEARLAVENFAEGCGLLRTEFLFLDRLSPPDEDEQAEQYQAVADALGARPLAIRTLDIGADKPAPYLALEREENPALGLRGLRVGLERRDLLEAQLRAILRVKARGPLQIMLPMVSFSDELAAARAMLDELRAAMGREEPVPLGVMVETPAAALIAGRLAEAADFFSIGTNDLAQYALAIDRGHPGLAGRLDPLHPAVLRLVAMTAEAGAARGRSVSVCGGAASDLAAAAVLVGLGVGRLSAAPARVPEIKAFIRTVTMEECREAARRALAAREAAEVRAIAREIWPHLDEER
ncbi:phosphoenolpyruvate--protein phosphotransferase [Amphiplicatus metriothermophilus]|uniref:phosphoenolpyruvate--protein phosphotransferase n=1 Tax=Amphiplicatus metriothermophilus TaxID=1519374 RepID=A0A239PPQ8_9PROT|nr:phosphoenolpyruvate--protein phosphotransferase [Amphiplicatus metriothermophilus]MBB5518733.1 phosphocarrier protein FPr/phosphocarrier protein [Amphiplicatus metriothermophilus]SNT72110.1 Phosphocarrier protein HPr /phosphoenolpyruvate--protein phosphotransferase /PTS system IIA component, Glc family [Amphiplicatus metriothermophilus]